MGKLGTAPSSNAFLLFVNVGGGRSVKQIALKLTTISPLSIRSDHSPTGAAVAPYIPGSTLMGCLASVHRMLHGDHEEQFRVFFLSDNVQYPNLYPASFKNDDMQNAFTPLYCIPRTAQTCKRFKGFLPLSGDEHDDDDDEAHGVRDSLFDWAQFSLLNKAGQVATDEESEHIISSLQKEAGKSRVCTCGEPLDNYSGFYRWSEDDRASAKSKTRLITRTGINRKYGIVEDQILYNREMYEEDMRFFGIIQAEDDIAIALRDFLWEKDGESGPLLLDDFARLGTARTRGFGRVAFEVELVEDEPERFEQFKKRLQLFDEALRASAQTSLPQPFYFALTLQAPVILSDELLRYVGTISEKQLASLIGRPAEFPASTFELLYHSESIRRIMGWQDLWGLPRTHAYAIDGGSVFLFAATQPLDDILAHALFTLEELGIGQRRAEGFGRICISDPFHRERELR
jgi:CRISPR-associated protein Csx10